MSDPAPETYRTLAGRGEAAFEVHGSEFIGHAAPASDVEGAEAFVASVEAEYDDATHNVPAYRVREGDSTLGSGMLREYSSDDGEPSGSAGKPTLNVLQGQELENVVVVVTRYYGGTNLGVGGLVRAYSRAAKEAVADAGSVEEEPHESLSVVAAYDDSGTVRGIIESTGYEFEATYEDVVRFEVRAPVAESDGLRDRLRSATSGRADVS
ncbi:IMPACT family protein [Halomarina litorea]|uniref:IMPACT family protein n=1 Tax=Halomarina litorea TaxID=2961595 RepID=UPI0020C4D8F7|nr:YigZ family protein [Halomarina sp. BCD28]